ncbi:MAG: DNA mismatch repair protein MutS [Acholeplasmataceae bacterium]
MSLQKIKSFTPMMQQYLKIKEDYADAIVFFRLGDFYEMFFDDAIVASKVLEIALTSRDAGSKIPMCGIPHHAAKAYIQKLINNGFKIAIAEQVTEPGKGLVQREVIKVITPGTVLEEGLLDEKTNNYIGSIILAEKGYIVTYLDLSTGETYLADMLSKAEALDVVFAQQIRELVLQKHFDRNMIESFLQKDYFISYFDTPVRYENKVLRHLNSEQKRAAALLLSYLEHTQKQTIHHLVEFKVLAKTKQMAVDYRVKRHLEIFESQTGQKETTLIHWLDQTKTAMGGRRLRYILNNPTSDKAILKERYDWIEAFSIYHPRQRLLEELQYIYDINRLVGRITFQNANARDLYQLKETLKRVPNIVAILQSYEHEKITSLADKIDPHLELTEYLEKAIADEPPLTLKEGGMIKEGFNKKLDEYRNVDTYGNQWLEDFEQSERERTGIKNLRIGYNRVFGYYIEISKGNTNLVKDEFGYERKQTLTNSERYINPVLKEKEDHLLHAKEKSIALEYELFKEIRSFTEEFSHSLQILSQLLADVDVFSNFAIISEKYAFVRPELTDDSKVEVIKGRHPVVERFVEFVANDVKMEAGEIFLITGPNMSGKSTYMRMYALIVYLAQTGMYVPAAKALIPIYDALFTRIGSSDDISGGKSTFMVEMVESNEALTKATNKSLILFDEIGRGTATYDGMALAQGMIEYIHEKIMAQTFFSTHYHELTALEESLERLINLSVKAKEEKNTMVFLHQVEKGASDRSYGLQVAALAHLPKSLLERSKQILHALEQKETKVKVDLFNYDKFAAENEEVYLDLESSAILDEIEKLETDYLTPMDALVQLKHFQNRLKKKK